MPRTMQMATARNSRGHDISSPVPVTAAGGPREALHHRRPAGVCSHLAEGLSRPGLVRAFRPGPREDSRTPDPRAELDVVLVADSDGRPWQRGSQPADPDLAKALKLPVTADRRRRRHALVSGSRSAHDGDYEIRIRNRGAADWG
jgi:hypothetical protein